MEEVQKRRTLLLRRIAVATVAFVAVVAGLGMAPAGADDVSAEAGGSVRGEGTLSEAEARVDAGSFFLIDVSDP